VRRRRGKKVHVPDRDKERCMMRRAITTCSNDRNQESSQKTNYCIFFRTERRRGILNTILHSISRRSGRRERRERKKKKDNTASVSSNNPPRAYHIPMLKHTARRFKQSLEGWSGSSQPQYL